jgi:hypothetical protein
VLIELEIIFLLTQIVLPDAFVRLLFISKNPFAVHHIIRPISFEVRLLKLQFAEPVTLIFVPLPLIKIPVCKLHDSTALLHPGDPFPLVALSRAVNHFADLLGLAIFPLPLKNITICERNDTLATKSVSPVSIQSCAIRQSKFSSKRKIAAKLPTEYTPVIIV